MRVLFATILLLLAACASEPPATSSPPTLVPDPPTAVATAIPVTLAPKKPTPAPSPTSSKPAIQTPAWFNDVVLYEIFPRSFYDTNENGIGDLDGVTAKLDYLQELGVGAIWLTPIFASPSYHGYDTTDYYAIHPDFGTEEDLVELVQAAHERDIRVLLDFVAGHTSDEHPFFKDAYGNPQSEYADWYRWLNDAHTSYEHFASAPDLPRLNQDNPATRDYLIEAAKYWKETADIDGYRLDYALGVSHDFWKAFRTEMKALDPDFLLLGEVWDSGLKIMPYYDNEFDATFDFPVYFDLMGSHARSGNSTLLGKGSPSSFQSSLQAQRRLYNPGAQSVHFLNNHDTVRAASQLDDMTREKLAATLLLTLPATPMVYYGEEIGMRGDKTDGDRSVREPMDWFAAEDGAGMVDWYAPPTGFNVPADGISVEEQAGKPDSLLEHYRALMALRAQYPALRTGEFVPIPLQGNPKAVAFVRRDDADTFLVVLNLDTQPITIPIGRETLQRNVSTGEIKGFEEMLTGETLPPPAASPFMLEAPPLTGQLLRVVK